MLVTVATASDHFKNGSKDTGFHIFYIFNNVNVLFRKLTLLTLTKCISKGPELVSSVAQGDKSVTQKLTSVA
jgi:hypothetical protein